MEKKLKELNEEDIKALQEKEKSPKKDEELNKKLEQYKEDNKVESEEIERRKTECANVCAAIFGSGLFWFVHIAFWLILLFKAFIVDHVEDETPYAIVLIVTTIIYLILAFWGVMNRKTLK